MRTKRYREWEKEYRTRPPVIARRKELQNKYRQDLSVRKKEAERSSEYRKTHGEEIRAKAKAKYVKDRDKIKEEWAKNKDYRLRKKYGLSESEFQTMIFNQGSKCAICQTGKWGRNGPVVDHNHDTGNVRGILCYKCNLALGLFRDNRKIVSSAARYLKEGKGENQQVGK